MTIHLRSLFTSIAFLALASCTPQSSPSQTESSSDIPPASELETPEVASAKTSSYLTAQELTEFPLQTPTISVNGRHPSPFDSIAFDRVIAYDYNDTMRPRLRIWDREGQRWAGTVMKQKALTANQAQSVIDLLTTPSTYGHGTASCFDPRLALIFYQGQKKVLVIDICLDCNYLESSVKLPAQYEKKRDLGEGQYYPLRGFSKAAQQAIVNLGKELDFYYGTVDADRLATF